MTGATFLGASTPAVCGSMGIFAPAVSTLISSLFSSGAFLKQRSTHAPDRSNGLRLLRGAAQQYSLNNIPQTIFEMKKCVFTKQIVSALNLKCPHQNVALKSGEPILHDKVHRSNHCKQLVRRCSHLLVGHRQCCRRHTNAQFLQDSQKNICDAFTSSFMFDVSSVKIMKSAFLFFNVTLIVSTSISLYCFSNMNTTFLKFLSSDD
jgi:hypothetical protein